MQRRLAFARAFGIVTWCLASLICVTAFQARQGGPPQSVSQLVPPTGTAAISGVVTDGVTGKPLAGAIVTINGLPTTPPPGRSAGPANNPRGRHLTDDLGRFVATDLPGGFTYTITAARFGYFDGGYGRPGLSNTGTARRIALVDGQWFRDASIELTPHGSISGTVLDEAGEPIVDVAVRAYSEVFVSGSRHLASSAMTATDDRGQYRLSTLAPGRYLIAVPSVQHAVPLDMEINPLQAGRAAGSGSAAADPRLTQGAPVLAGSHANRLFLNPNGPPLPPVAAGQVQVYPSTFYPGTRSMKDATAIDLKPGEERVAVNLQIRPVPAVTISGALQGPPEALRGMPLRLMAAGAEGLGRGAETATAIASADGTFAFLNIPAGSYTILASRTVGEYESRATPLGVNSAASTLFPGTQMSSGSSTSVSSGPQGLALRRQTYAGENRYYGRQTVVVANRDLTGVSIPLQMGVTISGRYVFEGKNQPAIPTLGGWITAEPANGDPALSQFRSARPGGPPSMRPTPTPAATPNPAEEFVIEGVQPGEFLLRPLAGMVKSIMWNGRDYTDQPFDTSAGRDITGVVITTTDQAAGVSGVVRDAGGQPAADMVVIYFPADRALWARYGPQPTRLRALTASSDGRYQAINLQAGDYFLIAVDDEHAERWKDPAFLDAASRVATRVQLEWGDRKVIDLVRREVK